MNEKKKLEIPMAFNLDDYWLFIQLMVITIVTTLHYYVERFMIILKYFIFLIEIKIQ